MTALRLALAAALSLTLFACDRGGESPDLAGTGNALLDYIPAETPYLAANLEPLPEGVVDAYLQRLQPVFDEMQIQLSAARRELEAGQSEEATTAGVDPAARLALALIRELDGKLSRAGLSTLGLDVLSHKVMYGLGAFPVLRMGLSDPVALRASIQRVLADAEIKAPEQTYQGVPFWRVAADDPQDAPLGIYIAIMDEHLAVAGQA